MREKNTSSSSNRNRGPVVVGCSIAAAAMMAITPIVARAAAAPIAWTGSTDGSFNNAPNWSGGVLPANDLATNIGQFNTVTANQPTLSGGRSIGGLAFTSATGGWALGGNGTSVLGIGGSGISTAGQTSGTDTISSLLSVGATGVWQAGTGGTLLLSGVISGSNNSTITYGATANAGNIILSAANTYALGSGSNNVAAGLVQLSGSGTLGSVNNTLTGSTTGTVDLNAVNLGIGALNGSAGIENSNTATLATLTLGNNNTGGSYGGAITGNLALVKTGTNTQQINGANSFTGGITINGGTLRSSTGFGSGAIVLNGSSQLLATASGVTLNQAVVVNSTGNSFTNNVSATYGDTVGATITGSGYLTTTGNAEYFSGDLTGFNGTLDLEGSNSSGKNNYQFNNKTAVGAPNATVILGSTTTQAVTLQWVGTSGTSMTVPIGALGSTSTTVTNLLENSTANSTATFAVGNAGVSTSFTGQIINGGSTDITALGKVGAATLTLSGANTYTGGTSVTGGTLALLNAGSVGTGAITIGAGATLDASATTSGGLTLGTNQTIGGTGTFAGNLSVGAGKFVPGTSLGTFTDNGSATFGSTSTFAETINSTTGTDDTLVLSGLSGNLTLGGSLTITDLGAGSYTGSYTLATFTGALSGMFATVTGLPSGYQVDYSQPNEILLDPVAATPEPTSLLLLSVVGLPLLGRRRRRD